MRRSQPVQTPRKVTPGEFAVARTMQMKVAPGEFAVARTTLVYVLFKIFVKNKTKF